MMSRLKYKDVADYYKMIGMEDAMIGMDEGRVNEFLDEMYGRTFDDLKYIALTSAVLVSSITPKEVLQETIDEYVDHQLDSRRQPIGFKIPNPKK